MHGNFFVYFLHVEYCKQSQRFQFDAGNEDVELVIALVAVTSFISSIRTQQLSTFLLLLVTVIVLVVLI